MASRKKAKKSGSSKKRLKKVTLGSIKTLSARGAYKYGGYVE
jgi:hypothetical protein